MIEFLCPEGHRIRCPKEKAGRPAKCPKCGVGFRIPTLEELGLKESAGLDSSSSSKHLTDVSAVPTSALSGLGRQSSVSANSAKDQQIEFLCPNGHHLHGPAGLQGRAGECPECGSRFRIPIIDQPEAAHLLEPEVTADSKDPVDDEITLDTPEPLAEPGQIPAAEPSDSFQVLDDNDSKLGKLPGISGSVGVTGAGPRTHPLAAIFIELWAARNENSRVEIHLESGSVLSPDGYSKSHSQRDYAVLVSKDPDGLSTVTVVPWNSISKIIIRAVKHAPGDVIR